MALTAQQREQCELLWPAIQAYAQRCARGTQDGEGLAGEVLVEAVLTHDPSLGLPLIEYAKLRVRNAINNLRRRERLETARGFGGGCPDATLLCLSTIRGRHWVDHLGLREDLGLRNQADAMDVLPDTHSGHTWHRLIHGVLDRMPRDRIYGIAFLSWICRWQTKVIAEHFHLSPARVSQLLGEAQARAKKLIERYGEAELTPNNVPWPEPTKEEQNDYAWYLANCEDLRQRWSISIPLDAWLEQGKPLPSAAKDISDELYRRIGKLNHARAKRHRVSRAARRFLVRAEAAGRDQRDENCAPRLALASH